MYINLAYKDAPELSTIRRKSTDEDLSVEKILLVNPSCPVRIMLEYIRKRCRLGTFTTFDVCDETGVLMGLFNMPTYLYATDHFVHKKMYYIIVFKQEPDKSTSVLPQLNHENKFYEELRNRVTHYVTTGEMSPTVSVQSNTPMTKSSVASKPVSKKK